MKPLPIAIVGLNFGRHIVDQLLRAPGKKYFRIAAVCDMDKAKAEAMATRLKCKAYTDLGALLKDKEIPVIGLYTGPNGRAALLRKIIAAGKDAMTTKPFEVDPKEAAAVLREARKKGRTIFLNSPGPVPSDDLEQIAAWVKQYDLGRPVGVRADVWGDYTEKADGTWYDDPARCPVAPVFRLGIYLINDLLQLVGPAESVQIVSTRIRTGRPTPDNAQLSIRFKNGAIGAVYASFCVGDLQHYRNPLALHYERGSIYRNLAPQQQPEGRPAPPNELTLVTKRKNGAPLVLRKSRFSNSHGDYRWDLLHKAATGGKVGPTISPEQVAAGIAVIAAMARAEKSGRTEKV